MKGLHALFLGLFGTFAFSWLGLALIPNMQIGHLDPQMDEEATDIYPMPTSGMAVRGREVYTANGCFYCHSQQIRPTYIAADIDRKWGDRRSAPRDYIFNRPVLLGKMRMGPDLANIGQRAPQEEETAPAAGASPAAPPSASPAASPAGSAAPPAVAAAKPGPSASPAAASPAPAAAAASPAASPAESPTKSGEPALYSAAWHYRHLYSPRSLNLDSNMPAYRFLFQERRIHGERAADALMLTGEDAPPAGFEVVPTYDAKCLVAYLMSLNQSHPLNEVKPLGAAAAAAPKAAAAPAASSSPAAAGSPAAAPSPAKK